MFDSLSYADYAPHVNTKFQLTELENTEVELIEAAEKNFSPAQEMFSLIFRGSNDDFLPQGIYRLRHEALGEGELFLVPVAQDADGYQYEAGFNRLVKN